MSTARCLIAALAVALLTACNGTHTSAASLSGYHVSTDPRVLEVIGIHGACDTVLATKVVETDSAVRIRVPLRITQQTCSAVGLPLDITVRLGRPLGDRQVIDDRRSRPLTRSP